jgi:hypothetical protein
VRPLHPVLMAYLGRVRTLAAEYPLNPNSERILAQLHTSPVYERPDQATPAALEAVLARLQEGLYELPPDVPALTSDPHYLEALRLAQDEIHPAARKLSPAGFGVDGYAWEHAAGLYFLLGRGIREAYEEFLGPLKIRSGLTMPRNFYYKRQLQQLVDQHLGTRPLDVLEIGAGSANLAVFLAVEGLVRNYCIVDLPDMLVYAGYTVQKYLPEAELFINEAPRVAEPAFRPRFWLLAPGELGDAPSASFDLCLSVNAFQEMDRATRDGYIEQVYRLGKSDALFFNVNRRLRGLAQPDGTTYDNNPLLYPYRASDRILVWEEDEYQQATRSTFGVSPSLAVTRAAIINPSSGQWAEGGGQ